MGDIYNKKHPLRLFYHSCARDVLYVMSFLGHKSVKNTMLCIQLEKALFSDISDDFTCRVVKDAGEAKALVEVGFEYVCTTPRKTMLFRKRK